MSTSDDLNVSNESLHRDEDDDDEDDDDNDRRSNCSMSDVKPNLTDSDFDNFDIDNTKLQLNTSSKSVSDYASSYSDVQDFSRSSDKSISGTDNPVSELDQHATSSQPPASQDDTLDKIKEELRDRDSDSAEIQQQSLARSKKEMEEEEREKMQYDMSFNIRQQWSLKGV